MSSLHGTQTHTLHQTGEDARFYGLSAKLPKAFSNDGKDLVIQYVVKHEQRIDCGGAYIKLMGPGVDQVHTRNVEGAPIRFIDG